MDDRPPDPSNSQPTPLDDEEYELEPLDPAIVAAEQRHAQEVAEKVRASIDIDEVYRDTEHNRSSEILENWLRGLKFRFHISQLLIGTALLAIVVAIASLGYLVPAITIFVIGSLLSLYFYLGWEDRKQQQLAHKKREELYAKRREQALSPAASTAPKPTPPIASPPAIPTAEVEAKQEPTSPPPFRIQFSLRSMLIAMTVAAVTFGLIHALGGPGQIATLLGLIAVGGLVVHAVGIEPPQPVILGWWFILALYVVLTIAGAMWSAG